MWVGATIDPSACVRYGRSRTAVKDATALGEPRMVRTTRAAVRGAGTGLQARLRSALLSRGWSRQPEPRVRFGQPLLAGSALLGPDLREEAAALVATAAAARAGRHERLGTSVTLGTPRDWHPRSTSVAWRQALHGLDELVALGVAAGVASSAQERADWVDAARDLFADWLARGRAPHGVAASVPALARRIGHLVQAAALFSPEWRADSDTWRALLAVVYADAVALAVALPRLPSDAWSIAAARSLVVAGRFFDSLEARGWVERGLEVLWAQLREQVFDDGGHVSRDSSWHAFVLGEYLQILAAQRIENDEVPPWCRKRIRGMADVLLRLAHADGTLALPSGVPVPGVRPVEELLAMAAIELNEPAFAAPGPLPGIWPLLVLGEPGLRAWETLARGRAAPGPRVLRRSRYAVFPGAPGDVLIADGEPPFAYELSFSGQRLLVGPGAGADEGHPMAGYARSARARNVLVSSAGTEPVPGGQAEVRWSMRDGVMCAAATSAHPAGVRYRRAIAGLPGRFWLVCEELVGSGSWTGESLIHLHPETRVLAACAGRPAFVASRGGGRHLAIVFAGTEPVALVTGAVDGGAQGWHAVAPGEFRPAPTIALTVQGPLPLVTGYVLLPEGSPEARLDLDRDAFHIRATIRSRGVRYELTILQDEVELATHDA